MPNTREAKYLCDSLIKRFEYSIDTLWKLLKIYMQEKLTIAVDFNAPRSIIQTATDAGVITKLEQTVSLECLNNRNETSHTYNEKLAEQIVISYHACDCCQNWHCSTKIVLNQRTVF